MSAEAHAASDRVRATRLGPVDDAAVTALAARKNKAGGFELEVDVPDMRCASCASRIEATLRSLRSVRHVRVNAARRRVLLEFDATQIGVNDVVEALTRAGYTPMLAPRADNDPALLAERRTQLKRLGVAGIAMMQVMMFSIALYAGAMQDMTPFYDNLFKWIALGFTTPVVLYSAAPFFRNAVVSVAAWVQPRAERRGGLSMDVPVALAIAIAFAASVAATITGSGHVYFDSVTMFTFLLLAARLLEQGTRLRLARLDNWLAMLPEWLDVERDGKPLRVEIADVAVNDRVQIPAGARIPVDGLVANGATDVDESPLTGESGPIAKQVGDRVFAGTLNLDQPISMVATAATSDTRMATIHRLAQRAAFDKPRLALLADRIASHFVVAVLVLAALTYIAWQLLDPSQALWATIAVLVVSCPCALSLATPTAITAASAALRRSGFVTTRADVIERLSQVSHVVFDKTGTLTGGKPELISTEAMADVSAAECTRIATALESHTNHPLAEAFETEPASDAIAAQDVRVAVGKGVSGRIDGVTYRLGSASFCGIGHAPRQRAESTVHLARETATGVVPLAEFRVRLWLRDDAAATLTRLRELGLDVELLTGDNAGAAAEVSSALADLPFRADMSPEAKLEHVRDRARGGASLLMVGDGINDVPSLAAATVSVAPIDATDLAKGRSDAILIGQGLSAIPRAIAVARRTRSIVRQNMTWAVAYNLTAIPLAACGLIPPWVAAIGMSLSSLGVTLNALRLGREVTPWK